MEAIMRRNSWTLLGGIALALAACNGSGSVGGVGGVDAGTGTGGNAVARKVDKLDILLAIDNSRSMADKQQILSLALGDLVESLANPPCIDPATGAAKVQPAGPLDVCPEGTQRWFWPITDIHVGVVTSSIGGHGADFCPEQETQNGCPSGAINTSNNDHGHLINRTDPCSATGKVPTYQDQGFLDWDPQAQQSPPGETQTDAFTKHIKDLVIGAGQVGCGYESQMESWYRFLVDPEPYQSISVVGSDGGAAVPAGKDDTLLAQRKAFLRPDSMLAILMLSDEDDCSTKEYGQFYLAAQQKDPSNPSRDFHLPLATKICETNPADACCVSCAQTMPAGCSDDLAITGCGGVRDPKTDDLNLRCWDQKRRFGIDFLYPIDRYVEGLTSAQIPNRSGQMVDNPLYVNLDPERYPSAPARDPGLVVLTGIVGVPWEDLTRRDANGIPDMNLGYKSAVELARQENGYTTWDVILGKPESNVAPLDPHMIASTSPRTGTNPITGTSMAPTTAAVGADPISGHEYTVGTQNGVQVMPNDLQYACIWPLAEARDCTLGGACDCTDPKNDNPLCEPDPAHNNNRTLQMRAKAYPGLRHLQLLRELGPQGVVASICPYQLNDDTSSTYAYRPAIQALITRVQSRLLTP
jgi:hypothetical protein